MSCAYTMGLFCIYGLQAILFFFLLLLLPLPLYCYLFFFNFVQFIWEDVMFNVREHWGGVVVGVGWEGDEGKVMQAVHGEVIERIWLDRYLLHLGV